MKYNEEYMIPAYENSKDTPVLTRQVSPSKTLYKKHWRATVQRLQKNAVVEQTLTVDARVDLKVNAAITQIESRFSNAGKFLRAELLRMKQSGIAGLAVISIANRIAEEVDEKLSVLANKFGLVWSVLFEESIWDYYGTFTTIEIDGVEYHINRNNFTAVAIGPDGKLIVPENAKLYDEQLLELMKQRDVLPEGSAPRVEIEAEIQRIYRLSDRETRSVSPNKPYEFYVLGEDVTERLNECMRQTEVDYAHMHKRYWVENLKDFYLLVRNGGKMDLKNQPEWQHSAYIYDGELVSQDALGNINYGYFGRFCNIPKSVLLVGAGLAQLLAGTSDIAYLITFLDDPRDAYRVMQGIEIYHSWH